MSDDNDNGQGGQGSGGGQGPGGRAPLTLKPRTGAVSAGIVRQSFSHGRSKTVVVETKRRRVEGQAPERPTTVFQPAPRPQPTPAAAPQRPAPPSPAERGLSQDELAARQRAIQVAQRATEERLAAEAAARRREAEARAAAARLAEPPASAAPPVAAPPRPVPAAQAQAPAPAEAVPAQAQVQTQAPSAPPPSAPPVASPAPAAPPAPRAWETLGSKPREERPREPRPEAPRADAARPAGAERQRTDFRSGPEGRSYAPPPREGGYQARGGDRPQGDRAPRPPGGGYPDRGPRPAGGGYAARPGGERPQGDRAFGDRGPRPPRDGDRGPRPESGGGTVRYSALAPARPGAPRPGGGGGPRIRTEAPSAPEITKTQRAAPPRAGERRPLDDDDRRRNATNDGKAVSRTKGEPGRRQGRLTIQAVAGDEDSAERMRSLASVRRAREREKEKRRGGGAGEQARSSREVVIPDAITVSELGQRMAVRGVDIIKYLMRQGTMLKINDVLDADTAELIASEFGHEVKRVSESDVETGFLAGDDHEDDTLPRPPVVAVMGHVDHGKTSLLDALRAADVAGGEHGGITQHIGAYQVRLESGERVTFLDTPGHAAFSAMRARGANVTDIVILVVAADDGVMPQTIEAISHARAAGAPLIVAINKMDKPDANPQRVINELLQHEVVVESLGGETQAIEVSATKRQGLDALVEAILLQAEVMDLRANPDRSAEGVVIEAKLDKGRGPVATVLVKRGTLKRGDIIVAGSAWGRVRALVNERGEQVPTAGPSEPVEVLGLDEPPAPGDAIAVVENEARARELTDYRERVRREKSAAPSGGGVSLADMMAKLTAKKVSELPVVVKADVGGSAEAIVNALDKLGTDEVRARIIHSAAGAITESDVLLAKGAGAPILGFNVRASAQARQLAEREGVEIRYYAIIYDLIDDIKAVLSGMLSPTLRETFLGNAEVLQVFDISKVGKVAGCRVTEGTVRKGAKVRIIRQDIVVLELGTLQTLKRFKDEVNEVVSGQECGMNFGFSDIREGDTIECFTVETIQRSL
jgi:translation initiation factor IF-2